MCAPGGDGRNRRPLAAGDAFHHFRRGWLHCPKRDRGVEWHYAHQLYQSIASPGTGTSRSGGGRLPHPVAAEADDRAGGEPWICADGAVPWCRGGSAAPARYGRDWRDCHFYHPHPGVIANALRMDRRNCAQAVPAEIPLFRESAPWLRPRIRRYRGRARSP